MPSKISFKKWESGEAPVTRGSKREDKHSKHIQNELDKLNGPAKSEGRHQILDVNKPTCSFCNKSGQRYHILTFVSRQCTNISDKADAAGSTTRAATLSSTRQAVLDNDIKTHNRSARAENKHFIINPSNPTCKWCKKQVARSRARYFMKQHCKSSYS